MTGLYVPDATGQFVKVTKGLWAADVSGTFQPVRNAWAADAAGTYQKCWPYNVAVNSFSGAKGAAGYPGYYALTLSWSVTNANHVELRLAGSSTVLYTGTGTSQIFTGTPGASYTFNLRAVAADGSFYDSNPVTVTLDPLPAPGNFRKTANTSTSADWAWNTVAQASGYQVVDTLANNAVRGSVGAVGSWHEAGLLSSTTYERAVQAKLGSAISPNSNKVRYTTAAPPGAAPGTYDFRATSWNTWASLIGWRGQSSGVTHGDGDNWGGHSGVLTTIFFYDLAAIQALYPAKVTRFKIYMSRDSSNGSSAPQANRFWAGNGMATQPAGSPIPNLHSYVDSGSLAWGQAGWFDLPVSWAMDMIGAYHAGDCLGWGNVLARYMRGPNIADQGHISITVG